MLRAGALGSVGIAVAQVATMAMRRQVAAADAVIYVSQGFLQRIYPAHPGSLQLARSNVQLTEDSFATHRRPLGATGFRIISIG
ncbi:hypothetical protein, partial [Auraticoccus monumenti]|uniref:hypothetical protein n=1 Tax=Auraticoccus monumenti TaxID=675864 RepID=UPI001E3F4879